MNGRGKIRSLRSVRIKVIKVIKVTKDVKDVKDFSDLNDLSDIVLLFQKKSCAVAQLFLVGVLILSFLGEGDYLPKRGVGYSPEAWRAANFSTTPGRSAA